LTFLEPSTITPHRLLRRIKSLLSASWEELEVDSQYIDQMRKYGRSQALLRMVSPLVVLYQFWMVGRSGIGRLFLKLSTIKLVVVRQADLNPNSPLWPYTSSFEVRVDPASEDDSIIVHMKKSLQKVLRASLELLDIPRPAKKFGHPDLEVSDGIQLLDFPRADWLLEVLRFQV